MKNELVYWMALMHTPKIWTSRKNELVIAFWTRKKKITDFFTSERGLWATEYGLSSDEILLLDTAVSELPQYTFLLEDLLEQGYELIPILSPDYPCILKDKMKKKAPVLLYIKGNKNILKETSIAIVGSRKANEVSLKFTDNVAKRASGEFKVVVSGFAKGVDRQALDSAMEANGQSIIVLPQGIMTFASGFKKYYSQIVRGDVLVLSTFHPKAPWSVELAMARNSTIYGLAQEIYVASSDDKGGTWSGATEGLKNKNRIFVRLPETGEKNANVRLIDMGAVPVNIDGEEIYSHVVNDEGPSYSSGHIVELTLFD